MSVDDNLVTLDAIFSWFKEQIENRHPVSVATYLDAAAKAIVLLQDLDEDLVRAEMACNRTKADLLVAGESAASAKEKVKAMPEYEVYLTLKAKKERVCEFIRIAKKRTEIIV